MSSPSSSSSSTRGVRAPVVAYILSAMALMLCAGCKPPGKPTTADIELKPEEVRDFAALYQQSCAGCHGQDGKAAPRAPLRSSVAVRLPTSRRR